MESRSKPLPLTRASCLFTAALLTVSSSPVTLSGMPAPPVAWRTPALGAAVAILEMKWQEPSLTTLEEALPRARMPRVRVRRLTLAEHQVKLRVAHGSDDSRAVRRRRGSSLRRHFAPTL